MDKTYTNGSDRTEEHILVCLSSSPSNKKIVHTAAAMAAALHARFTALYVQNRILSDTSDKKRLEEHIHFAEKLGAEIVTTHGEIFLFKLQNTHIYLMLQKSLLDRAMQNEAIFSAGPHSQSS